MPGIQCVVGCECAKHGGKPFEGKRRAPRRRAARLSIVKPENLHKMSNEEVHERWPSTLGEGVMPDHAMYALLEDMQGIVYEWRQRQKLSSSLGPTVHNANLRADEILGVRRGA